MKQMTTISTNNKRIAKNTFALYFRQILVMLVSLYTVRIVLDTLGVEDYGLYTVVAGVVTMFSFLSGVMATASQRYFSFELGRGNLEQLKKIFNLTILIYALISILILLLSETIGLWFVSNKLVIPLGRESSAMWVYQFAVISFLFTIMTTPYMAMIIAREDMKIYAYMSIVDVSLRLGIVFLLRLISWDKLQLYGLLILAVTVITTSIYRTICLRKYKECKFSFFWDKKLFKEITSYSGWHLFGNIAYICKNQLINILLNQFFGPAIIAARGIATSVSQAITSFSQNFSTAIRPQIIKNYAANQKEAMLQLMFRGAKITYLLMYLFVLPLILEMSLILKLWLTTPPEYVVIFTQLVLLTALAESIAYPIMTAVQAIGKVKMYQLTIGIVSILLNLPVSWMILRMGAPPYSVAIVGLIATFILVIIRLFLLRRLMDYSIRSFIKIVLIPVCIISILSAILPVIVYYNLEQGIFRLCIVTILSIISIAVCSYFIGLNKEERQKTREVIVKYFHSKKKGLNFKKEV